MIIKLHKLRIAGFAMMFALMAILMLAGLGTAFLKFKDSFFGVSDTEKTFKLLRGKAITGAELTKNRILQAMSPKISALPDAGDSINYQTFDSVPSVFAANGAKDPNRGFFQTPTLGEWYSIQNCREFNQAILQYIPCTTARSRMPKIIDLVYHAADSRGSVSTARMTFEIAAASLNQFSYLVTDAHQDFHAGATGYAGTLGVFFANPGSSSNPGGNFFHLIADPQGGATFDDPLVTNLPDATGIVVDTGAATPNFKSGILLGAPSSTAADISQAFGLLRNSPTYSSYANTPADGCGPSYDSCQLIVVQKSTIELGGPSGDCTVNATQTALYNAHPVGAAAGVTSNVTSTLSFFDGIPKDNDVFLTSAAPTYVGAPSGGSIGTLCHSNLFLSDGPMYLTSSIAKSSNTLGADQANSVFMSQGNFTINDQTMLMNGNTIATQRSLGSLSATTTSLQIQASVIPAGVNNSPSSLVIDPSVYSAQNAGSAVNLGTLTISGMLASGEATYTHFVWNGTTTDGFSKANIVFNPSLAVRPPPGIDIPIEAGYRASIISMSVSDASMSEALAALAR